MFTILYAIDSIAWFGVRHRVLLAAQLQYWISLCPGVALHPGCLDYLHQLLQSPVPRRFQLSATHSCSRVCHRSPANKSASCASCCRQWRHLRFGNRSSRSSLRAWRPAQGAPHRLPPIAPLRFIAFRPVMPLRALRIPYPLRQIPCSSMPPAIRLLWEATLELC